MKKEFEEKEKEDIIEEMLRVEKQLWRIVGVYVKRDMERKLEELKE